MEVTRIFDILPYALEKYPNQEVALASKQAGVWKKYNMHEYIEATNNISYGLIQLGIQKKDKIAIISNSRPEWNMLDMAIMQVGAITVPIYPTISQSDYRYILNHAEIKYVFVEGKELIRKIDAILPEIPSIKDIYTFKETDNFKNLNELIALGKANPHPQELEKRKNDISTNDVSCIIYTSGTTGNPKGVMLSHHNIVSQIHSLKHIPSSWCNIAFSFLPLCHTYEKMLVYFYQYMGMSVYYAESIATIGENIKEINPTIMSCVPRVLEKIYDKLYSSGKKLPFFKRKLYYWAFALASRYQLSGLSWFYMLQHRIANKLVYTKWREGIGGNFDIVVSGSAAIQPRIASFFSAIGMPVFEGYGLTETSPVVAVSNRDKNGRCFGTVGMPISGVEVKIAENNEIICRGHNIMVGYYKEPEYTKSVIDEDGFFHTGDTGRFTKEGQLVITGRLKSIFKTSFGKYINPQLIEDKFVSSPFIENIVVVGENQKFAAALILPDFAYLKSWAHKHKIDIELPQQAIENEEVKKALAKEVKECNSQLGDTEKIKKYELIADEWSQETGILTPTLKVKRNVIFEKYKKNIEKLFE
jgi:long-chain acyl-CoA synthetase